MSNSIYLINLDDKVNDDETAYKDEFGVRDACSNEEPQIKVRPQRNRNMLKRLGHFDVILDSVIDDDSELVHYTMFANYEPVDFKIALISRYH